MKKWILLLLVLSGCSVFLPVQRSNLIGVFHLIESGNFADAKEVVEDMIANDESSQWARTWFARGLLAQTAYVEGRKRNDKKLYELYPDQLFLAYSSFETARRLDSGGRLNRQLTPRYALLANQFMVFGEQQFSQGRHNHALRAFEAAISVLKSPLLDAPMNHDLIFNAAIAAYEAGNRLKAIEHLKVLHEDGYSARASHLLVSLYLDNDQTDEAEQVLMEGIERMTDNRELVLLRADLLYEQDNAVAAIELLKEKAEKNPSDHHFPFAMGIIYQKTGDYQPAIQAFKTAAELNPDNPLIFISLATCYFDLGVEIEERSRLLESSQHVLEKRRKSQAAFDSATRWLDKAYAQRPDDNVSLLRIYQLYRAMGAHEKARSVQRQFK